MKRIKTKDLLKTAFALFIIAVTMVMGCGGGGGGGSGRQTLPGENPAGPVIITGTGTGTGTGTVPIKPPEPTVAQKIDGGWDAMNFGNWGGAILYFDDAVNDSRATVEERQKAFNGRGWARVKYYDTLSGMSDFIQAGNLKESLLGYALGLIQQSTQGGIAQAVQILEDIGLIDPNYNLTLEHRAIGVSSAEAHAMLAYAYFWRGQTGDEDRARTQIIAARQADPSTTSSVDQIHKTLKKAGLTGI